MKGETFAGLALAAVLVTGLRVYSGAHITVTNTSTPQAVASVARPTPTPAPNGLDVATGITAHGALIAWLVALAILPFFALLGIALHARHRSRLAELDHPPLPTPEFVHRAFDVKALEARRGWLPESFTYSPHLRQDAPEVVEEPPQFAGPVPNAEALIAQAGAGHLVYGVRVDNGEPLVDNDVRSLLIGGQMGSGKSTLARLLAAQLHRQGARIVIGDPHALNSQSVTGQRDCEAGLRRHGRQRVPARQCGGHDGHQPGSASWRRRVMNRDTIRGMHLGDERQLLRAGTQSPRQAATGRYFYPSGRSPRGGPGGPRGGRRRTSGRSWRAPA